VELEVETIRSKYQITHQCICVAGENQDGAIHCPCFLVQDELCIFGQCSNECVEAKNHYFQETKGWEVEESRQEELDDFSHQLKE
jgi:hypothetical protein